MLKLVYGEDTIGVLDEVARVVGKYGVSEVVRMDAKDLNKDELVDQMRSVSMFGERQLVVVEGKLDVKLVRWEEVVASQSADLLLVYLGKLRANDGLLKKVQELKGEVRYFEEKVDSRIFPFLDAVAAKDQKKVYREYWQLLEEGKEPIYLVTMLVWQFRNLLFPEMAKGFLKEKAQKLRQNYKEEELEKIYYLLFGLDVALKTGEGEPYALVEQFLWRVTK
jgi:DNA polymerase III delta subunit